MQGKPQWFPCFLTAVKAGSFGLFLLYYLDFSKNIMPIEAVKIPQNVYVEDRIIGPVTLKQLFMTGAGLGISYVIFASAQKSGMTNVIFLGACWIPAVIGAAFSFIKINDISLFGIILISIEGLNKPSTRYWSPHPGISINLITRQSVKVIDEASKKAETDAQKLADITRQLEKRHQEMDKLSAHAMPSPQNVQGVKTQLEAEDKHGLYEHEEEVEVNIAPVRKEKVQTSGLDKKRSIDSITDAVKAYDNLRTTHS